MCFVASGLISTYFEVRVGARRQYSFLRVGKSRRQMFICILTFAVMCKDCKLSTGLFTIYSFRSISSC